MSSNKIKITTETIPTPDRKITTYQTTDGKTFRSNYEAHNHQRYLDAVEHITSLPSFNEWTLCKTPEDLSALLHKASNGEYSPNTTNEPYPCVVDVQAVYQDRDNYWITRYTLLTEPELLALLRLIDKGDASPVCIRCGSNDMYDSTHCWDCLTDMEHTYTS